MKIVLIGYRGTGKSTVASLLAKRLGWEAISTDQEIIARAKLSIPDIVAQYGWDHFRALESEVCRTLRDKDRVVVDTGGGVIVKEDNIPHLKWNALVFWLTAKVATITQRIGGDTQRPSLTQGKSFTEEIEEVLRDRSPKYEAAADHRIPTDTSTPQTIVEHILTFLPSRMASP